MANIMNDDIKQKKLCAFLSSLCLYATFPVVIILVSGIWFPQTFDSGTLWKIFGTYGILLIGTLIIQRIFIEFSKHKDQSIVHTENK